MYNIYSEEKKLSDLDKKYKEEKETLLYNEKHKQRTNNLALNYQKRIKKFIIDVRIYQYNYTMLCNITFLDGRRKPPYRNKKAS